jgi:hypothetical protein
LEEILPIDSSKANLSKSSMVKTEYWQVKGIDVLLLIIGLGLFGVENIFDGLVVNLFLWYLSLLFAHMTNL